MKHTSERSEIELSSDLSIRRFVEELGTPYDRALREHLRNSESALGIEEITRSYTRRADSPVWITKTARGYRCGINIDRPHSRYPDALFSRIRTEFLLSQFRHACYNEEGDGFGTIYVDVEEGNSWHALAVNALLLAYTYTHLHSSTKFQACLRSYLADFSDLYFGETLHLDQLDGCTQTVSDMREAIARTGTRFPVSKIISSSIDDLASAALALNHGDISNGPTDTSQYRRGAWWIARARKLETRLFGLACNSVNPPSPRLFRQLERRGITRCEFNQNGFNIHITEPFGRGGMHPACYRFVRSSSDTLPALRIVTGMTAIEFANLGQSYYEEVQ